MAASASSNEHSIPATFKAAVYDQPGTISTKIQSLPTREPGPGEVLVRLTHSGVCHSDLSIMRCSWKNLPFPTPQDQIGGHEGVGIVKKLGVEADRSGIKVGDRVGIKWAAAACGNCVRCREGFDGHCEGHKISGYFTPGTFAEFVVSPANYVTPIPEALDSADAAPLLCAGLTSYSALGKCRAKAGETVVVSGAGGGLGHLAMQIGSRGMGYHMIGIDHGQKKSLVMSCGAKAFIDVTEFDDETIAAEVKRLTDGLGAAAVIVCAGSNRAYAQALSMLRFRGTMVCVGMPGGELQAIGNAYPITLMMNHLSITGSTVGSQREALEVLDLAAKGLVGTHYRLEKLENLTAVFEEMSRDATTGRVVLDLQ